MGTSLKTRAHAPEGGSTRCHAHGEDPRARTRPEEAATRPGRVPRAHTRCPCAEEMRSRACTRQVEAAHAREEGPATCQHTQGGAATRRGEGSRAAHAPRSLALPEVSQHSEFIREEGHIKRDCAKYKAQDQSSETAATTVMAMDENESDVLLAASEDGKFRLGVGFRHCLPLVQDRESVPYICSMQGLEATLKVFKGNKEMLWGKKTEGLYRLEGSVQTGGATIRHGSSGISKKNRQGKQPLHKKHAKQAQGYLEDPDRYKSTGRCFGICAELCAQGRRDRATTTRKVMYFAAHPSGGMQGTLILGGSWTRSCQDGQLEDIGLPSSGLEGRLLSLAYLDESKPTWMSPSPVAKFQALLEFTWSVHVTVKTLEFI
ncbi:hypothetical protein Acr_18g0003730 [Actinidia rufa]|uniref:Uncharacterized protein n=1 Tax=Actinidia rufa TaxID=165716 RepID=A0A7J0G5Y6_9ERIC|nr:hypothetical protein Acr_18g0003730 [Actinidia rufa]